MSDDNQRCPYMKLWMNEYYFIVHCCVQQGLDEEEAFDSKEFDQFEKALEEEEAKFQEKHVSLNYNNQ